MNDALTDRCRVFANKHTLGNIARLGVGASKELAADVQAFVEAEVEKLRDANLKFAATLKRVRADSLVIAGEAGRLTRERDAALAEVERLKVFETAVIVYAISVFEFESAEIGQDGDQRMEMDAAERALLALVPAEPTP